MSRAGNMVGSFIVEDRSAGTQRRPWTPEDELRLTGNFRINGRATRPHVNTPAGPYVIGAVSLWCLRTVGQKSDGTPMVCARRKSRADDDACRSCGGSR